LPRLSRRCLDVEDVARRFGLTVRFVEGRLRLATLAPVVFEALAAGEITLDIAKAFGATSDQEIQARVFEQVSSAYYAPNPDSIRRMVLSGTVRGSDPRARLVGPRRLHRCRWPDRARTVRRRRQRILGRCRAARSLAAAKMEEQAKLLAAEQGLAWVKPTLDPYASHDLVEGLVGFLPSRRR
jgi:ParB family chromosome partitioning protein